MKRGPFDTTVVLTQQRHTLRPLNTNDDVLGLWRDLGRPILNQDITRDHYELEIASFLRSCGPILATKLSWQDVRDYTLKFAGVCGGLGTLWGRQPICRRGQDLSQCGTTCPGYQAREFETVTNHLGALVHLYDVLVDQGYCSTNVARIARKRWNGKKRRRGRSRKVRKPIVAEVQKLLQRTRAPFVRMYAALTCKTGFRPEEALRLEDGPQIDRARRRIDLPYRPGAKRTEDANHTAVIDRDLDAELERYQRWRSSVLERTKKKTRQFLITSRGDPLTYNALARRLREECEDLDLQAPKCARREKINPHTFRHYFSNEIKARRNGMPGVDRTWEQYLRGDSIDSSIRDYFHPDFEELERVYLAHAPRIWSS